MLVLPPGPGVSSQTTRMKRLKFYDECWIRSATPFTTVEAEGTQSPAETLRPKSGTCRDYAWLMIETLRRLGFASRFVSGYLYDAALDCGEVGMIGSSTTHAWLQVFLPGAGWMHYDPTNRINAGYDLIPVAIARHPGQAVPLAGSWFGKAQDYLGMSVSVVVRKLGDVSDPSE
jgi:transglutaminase-like putative cysteine protease